MDVHVERIRVGGFEFDVGELDGCQLVEVAYPRSVDISTLSAVIARYYDLWDADVPTVQLVDLSRIEGFTDELGQVLKSVIQRTVLQPSFVCAAWFTGANPAVHDEIVRLRREAGRPTDDVFETRDEAIAYLRGAIGSRPTHGDGESFA
jgi:hypothetical protein